MPSISLLEIINIVIPDPKTFFGIAASVAGAATVNPDVIIKLLSNGLSAFLLKSSRF